VILTLTLTAMHRRTQAGILDYHLSFGRHFTYPHMLVDGDDLLVVMRATYAPGGDDRPPPLRQLLQVRPDPNPNLTLSKSKPTLSLVSSFTSIRTLP